MKIMSIVGARPNFMKVAPIISAINEHNDRLVADGSSAIQHILIHTGQHYDELMSDSFFTDLNLPKPNIHLGVGSGSHAIQTAEIMRGFEGVLLQEAPDVLVVVGDVNSTLACALVAAKISFDASGKRPLIAHVEAGLRSFDRTMPEEINRILTDQVSDLLFVTEESGLSNLVREGIVAETVHFVGNTMIDSLLTFKKKAEESCILEDLGLRKDMVNSGCSHSTTKYALLTLHRPGNVDRRDVFWNILEGLGNLAKEFPVIFPAHPRTQKRIQEFGLEHYFESNHGQPQFGKSGRSRAIRMIDPLGYLDFLCLMKSACLVVTDSGGVQEETTCLGIPCVTVRENTERPVTIESGTNMLAGTTKERVGAAIRRQMGRKDGNGIPQKWDGHAGTRIVDVLISAYYERTPSRQSITPQPCVFRPMSTARES